MSDLILHHYAGSPFSEKIRLIFGFKGLAWRGVTVPIAMPKPDVVALTGGYRRTPFLQIGADVYNDTALIARVLERLQPTPALYPREAGGAAQMLAQWADTALFWLAIPYALQPASAPYLIEGATPELLKGFAADRAAMNPGFRRLGLADLTAQLQTCLGWLEAQLGDGRAFLLGSTASIADFSAAHAVWFVRRAVPVAGVLAPFGQLAAWYERVAAFGHGEAAPMEASEALAIALTEGAAGRFAASQVEPGLGFEAGARVTVNATDYGCDLVPGRLVGLSADEVVIERDDERAGTVHVHFPRIGFQLKAAA
ncbi:MAG TPA: glutathione S-transferase family protein [Ideonella sp.]|nr:glutathione S-transferase family protein [Ideonella sp.]